MIDASKTPANQEPEQSILSPEDNALRFGDMEPIPLGDPEDFTAKKSPFDIKGVKTNITREEIIEAIHEGRGNDRW